MCIRDSAWVAGIARKLLGKIMGKAADERSPAEKQADLDKGIAEAQALQSDPKATEASIRKGLGKIKSKYKMKSLDIVVDADSELEETLHVTGEVNPKKSTPSARIQKDGTVGPLGIVRKMLDVYKRQTSNSSSRGSAPGISATLKGRGIAARRF